MQSPAAIGYEARLCALPNHKRLSLERVLFSHSYHCSSWKGGKNICVNSPPFYFPCEYLAFRREKGRARETERRQNLPTVILPPLVWRLVLPIMKREKMLKTYHWNIYLILLLYKQKSQHIWATIKWFRTRKTLSKVKDTTWIWGRKKCREACERLVHNILLFYYGPFFVTCSDTCNSTTDDLSSIAWNSINSFYFPLLYTYTPSLLSAKAASWTHWTLPAPSKLILMCMTSPCQHFHWLQSEYVGQSGEHQTKCVRHKM